MVGKEESPQSAALSISMVNGKRFSISYDPSYTIEYLKKLIEDEGICPPEEQILIFAQNELEESKTLADYGIGKEETLHLLLKLRGGLEFRLQFNKLSSVIEKGFSD